MLHALYTVNGETADLEMARWLGQIAREMYPEREFKSIVEFNDHRETRFGDVEAVLEKAEVMWGER